MIKIVVVIVITLVFIAAVQAAMLIPTPSKPVVPNSAPKEKIAENLELVTFKKDGYLCFVIQRNDFYGGVAVSCLSEKGEN